MAPNSLTISAATPILPTVTAIFATITPDVAATATTVAFQEIKAGAVTGAFSNPIYAAAATAAVAHYDATQTAIALTPTETARPTLPPAPTRTPGVGLIADDRCIRALYGGAPRFPNCWEARVNGVWVLVGGGQLGTDGSIDDPLRSVILVCPERCVEPEQGAIYETPRNVMEVRVAAVNGTLVTFVPRDRAIRDSFVFDLATRQWMFGTPGPSPTREVSPLASVTP